MSSQHIRKTNDQLYDQYINVRLSEPHNIDSVWRM